ncbi:hypothetical protein RDV89_08875 [Nocardioides zeae]|uniref:MFS transporter n=1 Tax=Nocardioides imazamoxiresistens TaxID=3231893 RepID=A0ABU3PVF4_9ACTN|nr:hypothetical protein [Nocardioides zeae]MDT9593179.1 hypothetical protein [Nocardioides zeae]
MRATAPAPLRTRRALSTGAVCGLGAVVAHHVAGGSTPPLWLVVLATAVGALVALPLCRRRLDGFGAGAVALLAQGTFHLGFMVHDPLVDHGGTAMLLGHLVAGAVTIGVALGVERAWWALVDSALERLLPPQVQAYAPRSRRAPLAVTTRRPAGGVDVVVRAPRGPPGGRMPLPVLP